MAFLFESFFFAPALPKKKQLGSLLLSNGYARSKRFRTPHTRRNRWKSFVHLFKGGAVEGAEPSPPSADGGISEMALLFVATLRSKLLFSLRLRCQRKSGLGSAINSVKNVTRPLFKKQATKILKKAVKKIGKEFLGETIEGFAADGIQFGTQKYMEGYFKYMGMAK